MSECQRCGGRAHNAFLCRNCTEEVRQKLSVLPWWQARLTEAAIGHTRMSDTAGRKSARRKDLDGDAQLAACIELLPHDDDLDKARRKREQQALAHALATGGINARASNLLNEIADSLAYWCQVLCENRGLRYQPNASAASLGANHALWLWANTASIAASENALDIAGDIESHIDQVVKVVNRPIEIMFLGRCPTWVESRDDQSTSGPCDYRLTAPRDSIEVYCPRCRTTHQCAWLLRTLWQELHSQLKPWDELVKVNARLPTEYRVKLRTLQDWRAKGLLKPRKWQRADGRMTTPFQHAANDIPLYSINDVRLLQIRKPQRSKTGAESHVRNR